MAIPTSLRFGHLSASSNFEIRRGRWVGSSAANTGDLVTLDANGFFVHAVAAGNNIAAATRIARLNHSIPSTAPSGTPCEVTIMGPDTIIELQAVGAGSNAIATALTQIGDTCEIERLSNGNYVVDVPEATNAKVEIVGIGPTYALGTVGGTLLCKVLPAQRIN